MRFILLVALVAGCLFSSGQDTTSFSKWSVTIQPLGIIDPFLTNITAGVQYRINDKMATEFQAGIINTWFCTPSMATDMPDAINREEQNISKAGFKLNGQIKYFLIPKLYLAVNIFYNNYDKKDNEYVWRYAQSYVQRFDMVKSINEVGGNITMGFVLGQPSKRIYYEFFAGTGIKNKNLKIANELPSDAELINAGGFEQNGNFATDHPGNQAQPTFAFGITIGCKL